MQVSNNRSRLYNRLAVDFKFDSKYTVRSRMLRPHVNMKRTAFHYRITSGGLSLFQVN
jgi:hypothetical protein